MVTRACLYMGWLRSFLFLKQCAHILSVLLDFDALISLISFDKGTHVAHTLIKIQNIAITPRFLYAPPLSISISSFQEITVLFSITIV